MTSRSEETAARAHGRARLADAYLDTLNGTGPTVERTEKQAAATVKQCASRIC
jgi:hypothetical protein